MLIDRLKILWDKVILPDIRAGKQVVIVSHNHVLRGLIYMLKDVPEDFEQIESIPNAIPLIFELDNQFRVTKDF